MAKTSVNTMDQPMKIKESMAYRVFNVFNTILMILICAAMLYPFLYLVAQSFSSTEAIVAGEVGLIPKDFSVETYAFVINDGRFIPYYGNTIVYSVIATVCALFFSALLAYPLSKPELWGGKVINKFIIFTMYFGGGMIPNYILMTSLGLRDTVAAFILPGMMGRVLAHRSAAVQAHHGHHGPVLHRAVLEQLVRRVPVPRHPGQMACRLLPAPADRQLQRYGGGGCRRGDADLLQHQVLRHGADRGAHHLRVSVHPEVLRPGHDARRRQGLIRRANHPILS